MLCEHVRELVVLEVHWQVAHEDLAAVAGQCHRVNLARLIHRAAVSCLSRLGVGWWNRLGGTWALVVRRTRGARDSRSSTCAQKPKRKKRNDVGQWWANQGSIDRSKRWKRLGFRFR